MNVILNIIIFLAQAAGFILIGVGLEMIWTPLALIYAGTGMIAFGHLLYRDMKSEASET